MIAYIWEAPLFFDVGGGTDKERDGWLEDGLENKLVDGMSFLVPDGQPGEMPRAEKYSGTKKAPKLNFWGKFCRQKSLLKFWPMGGQKKV